MSSFPLLAVLVQTEQAVPASWRWASTVAALGIALGTWFWAAQTQSALREVEPNARRVRVRVILWVLVAANAVGTLLAIASLWEVRALDTPLAASTPTLVLLLGGALGVRLLRAVTERARRTRPRS